MIVYKSPELVKENIRTLVKKFDRWYKEEDSRIKKAKIYSACMKQFIILCNNQNLDKDFNEYWENAIDFIYYGYQSDSKRIVTAGKFKLIPGGIKDTIKEESENQFRENMYLTIYGMTKKEKINSVLKELYEKNLLTIEEYNERLLD